jgi:hypothetical protein
MHALRGLWREPFLHFILIGLAVFALFALLDDPAPEEAPQQIVITPERVQQLAQGFEAVWRRPPSAAELEGLVEDHIREEIYVREALALGLDRDDTVIRRRLRQKMEFLTTSGAEALTPSEEVLRAYYEENLERFLPAPKVSFRQIFLGETASTEVVTAARDLLDQGADPASLGQRTLLPFEVPPSPPPAVDGAFGAGFFDRVAALKPGTWSGPLVSGFGYHLVKLREAETARPPPFEAVRERVLRDWRSEQEEALAEAQYQKFRASYEVIRQDMRPEGGEQ